MLFDTTSGPPSRKLPINFRWPPGPSISIRLQTDERTGLAKDAIQNVKDLKLGAMKRQAETSHVADQFVEAGLLKDAASIFDELALLLKTSSDQKTKSLAANLYSKGLRLNLVGTPDRTGRSVAEWREMLNWGILPG